MASRIRSFWFVLASIATLVACTSGQRSSTVTESPSAEEIGKRGLTELAVAPAIRRVWTGPEVDYAGRPSPDGRSFSMTDWSSGNVALYDLATGTKRRITTDASWESPIAFAETSIISPDGRSLAYGWYSEKLEAWQLRIAVLSGADSGKIRTVYSLPRGEFVTPKAWTPDGSEVIAVLTPNAGTNHIAVIRPSGDGMRILRTHDWREPNNIAVSPSGLWIAYDFPTAEDDRDVYVVGIDGKNDRIVAHYKGDDEVLGWTGDHGRLLIRSERSGTPSIWALTLFDGNATGEPVLVRANMWRTTPAATTTNGTVFYSVTTGVSDVFTVAVDSSGGMIKPRGTSITTGNERVDPQAFGWSADGEYAAYVVRRGGSQFGPKDVIIRSLKRGNVRRLSPRMSKIYKIQWFANGRSMLVMGANESGEYGIFQMDVANASVKRLVRAELGRDYPRNLTISPDGKRILFVTSDSTDLKINELDANGKVSMIRRILKANVAAGLAFSRDGKSIAIAVRNEKPGGSRLIIAPLDGSADREAFRLLPSEELAWAGLTWTRDGRHLLFGVTSDANVVGVDDIRRLSLDDGKVTSTGLRLRGIRGMRVSPDGSMLMYGIIDISREMWSMDAPVFAASAGQSSVKSSSDK